MINRLRLLKGRILYWLMVPVLLIGLLIPLGGMNGSSGNCVNSSPGVIDLRGCQDRNQGVWKLDGQWEFYWQELLVPGDFESPAGVRTSARRYIEVPSQWPMFVHREGVGRLGYATYRVRLLLPEERHDYALKVTNIRSSSRLFIDGKLLGSSGLPGNSAASTEAGNNPYQVSFSGDGGEAELVIQAANFTYWSSGISESIILGDAEAIGSLVKRNETYDIAIMSSMAIMALYFLGQGLGLQRNPNRAFLYLALLCAAGAVYLATHSEKLLYDYIPNLSYEWFTRIQGVSTVASQLALAGYTYHLMPTRYSSFVFRYMTFFACVFTMLVLAVNVRTYSLLVPLTLIHTITVSLTGLLAMIRTIIARMPGAAYLFLAMLSLVTFIVVLTANMGWEKSVYDLPPTAFPVFLLCLGLYLSAQANHAYWTIRKLSDELNQKDKDKDEFLHRTSHELRTPLQAIAHISRAMTDGFGGRLNDRHMENAALIEQTANRLSILVNDIVDYERMKSGIIHLDLKTIQLARFIDVVLEVFQQLNLSGRVQLYNRVEPDLLVTADENRLTQIMFNLVENALKHTEEGSVTITAEVIGGRIFITVADTGYGMSDEKLNMLFRDYEQLAPHQRKGMSGLGLPFSRLLVQLHGGELRVQSEPGGGSRFTFSVSGSAASARSLEPSVYPSGSAKELAVTMEQVNFPSDEIGGAYQDGANSAAQGGKPYRILIVDDHVNARALMNLLTVEGYETVCVRNGEEALALLGDGGTFDLCIMDVMLPNMSGFALCRHIRKTYEPLDLPILMTTADTASRMNETGFAAGANDFIRKPYERGDLLARVRTLVQLKRSVSQMLNSEIAMLRAQIKPHFLYNAINTIIWMSKRDVEQARKLLRSLSDFLRGSFDFGNRDSLVSFQSELQLIQAYLALEQARFGDRLKVVMELETTEFMLPTLVVQPIVENAVRHGIMEKVEGGTVILSVRASGEAIEIVVSDDGIGMYKEQIDTWSRTFEIPDRGAGTGIGLSNVNRRLIRQFGETLRIAERPGGGTVVSMRIPILHEEDQRQR